MTCSAHRRIADAAVDWIAGNCERLREHGPWEIGPAGHLRAVTPLGEGACPLSAPDRADYPERLADRHGLPVPVALEIAAAADRSVGHDDRIRRALIRELRIGGAR